MLMGYARCSVSERQGGTAIATQTAALEREGAARVFADDGLSGGVALEKRPGWIALLDHLRPGDCIVMSDTSRLSRDLLNGLAEVRRLRRAGVGCRFLTGLDVSDPDAEDAELRLNLELSLAEHQRRVIGRKTRQGLARARAEGKTLGRRPEMTAERAAMAAEMLGGGATAAKTAAALGVSLPTLRHWRRENGF